MSMDPVNHPSHYTSDRFPFECIELTAYMDFCMGNMVKYVWRHLDKGKPLEDLKKARFYLNHEIRHVNPILYRSPTTWQTQQKLQALADQAGHCDYQPFWQALLNNDADGMLDWLDHEITRLEAYQ